MGRFSYLTIDFNSYFASVEQQMEPRLRGRPVAVVPIANTDKTCAIAASYEAKAYGVKTGTRIWEAKELCPELICVPARHDLYVDVHEKLKAQVENNAPILFTGSIDEFTCKLIGDECEPDNAKQIARNIKSSIRENVGECLTSSIGIAPTKLLSKIASDMQKPDGLTLIEQHDLPHVLHPLQLTDLPGIAQGMEARLHRGGVRDVAALLSLEPKEARHIWGSVGGERYWYELHGVDIPGLKEGRRTIGHSRVLSPDMRSPGRARIVSRALLLKAGTRLRRYGLAAGALGLAARRADRPSLVAEATFSPTQDSFTLLEILDDLWRQFPRSREPFKKVSIWISRLAPVENRPRDLFVETRPDGFTKKEILWRSVDKLVARYGRETVTLASQKDLGLQYLGAKIAFTRVPDAQEFRE
ncbi:MAG: type VI secretion protein ImpB [Xanthobacteraceae bacterium]|nr:type VI secretion protein ImpB [Xanthobacteraceae bacterium]